MRLTATGMPHCPHHRRTHEGKPSRARVPYRRRLREFGNEWRFQRDAEEARVRVTSNVVVNNSEVVRDLLLAGMGIGLVWNYAVDREIADGRLIPLLPDWTPVGPFGQTAYALWLPQSHLPPKIRVFVDFLAERLRETPN